MGKIVAKRAIYDAQKIRDDTARRQHKRDYKAENLPRKLTKVANKISQFKKKEEKTAEHMKKAWDQEQNEIKELKRDTKNEQIAVVNHENKKYLAWKEELQITTSKEIAQFQKAAKVYRQKSAEETARFNRLSVKLKEKKATLKEKGSKELKHKKERARIKENRVKIKERLTKQDAKLKAEKLQEKVIKSTAGADRDVDNTSAETRKAEDDLHKVNGELNVLNNDVATELTETTKDAVRSQELMLKAREKALNQSRSDQSFKFNFTENYNITDTDNKKKCGPGVLCSLYNKLVTKAGGSKKYYNLEAEELKKLKGDSGKESEEMHRQAFDKLASRFGVTGPGTEGKFCGPNVPCALYNKVVKAAGGNAKYLQEEATEEDKLMKTARKDNPKAEVSTEIKKQAFDKVADRHGITG